MNDIGKAKNQILIRRAMKLLDRIESNMKKLFDGIDAEKKKNAA